VLKLLSNARNHLQPRFQRMRHFLPYQLCTH
jgi:hypothetical protein